MRLRQRGRGRGDHACSPRNLRDLLLAAPAGTRATMGLDPGFRTGVKVAVVDAHRQGRSPPTTIYPHEPRTRLGRLARHAGPARARSTTSSSIAIGNGTASPRDRQAGRRPDQAASGAEADARSWCREAGASVYSASALAVAGAARPRRLAARRGVDRAPPAGPAGRAGEDRSRSRSASASTSTTSARSSWRGRSTRWSRTASTRSASTSTPRRLPLLARVSGLAAALARSIVAHRDAHGAVPARAGAAGRAAPGRQGLRAGAPASCASADGDDPLDASAVHPEAYPRGASGSLATTGGDARRR